MTDTLKNLVKSTKAKPHVTITQRFEFEVEVSLPAIDLARSETNMTAKSDALGTKGHDMAERIDEKIAWANRDLENMVWNMLDETYGDEIARSASIYVTLDGSGEAEVIHTDGSRKPEGTTKLKANGDVIKLKYIPEFNG
tara:strand:- start:917 stop:1336 length:420 start_codon:yes stop_codon:yes gene_type:complete